MVDLEYDNTYATEVQYFQATAPLNPMNARHVMKSLSQAMPYVGAQTVTVTSNAATCPVALSSSVVYSLTNSSSATLTITMATSGAVDGQIAWVRVYDHAGTAETIAWVNTENGEGTAPTTSNGSTTLPTATMFMFNGATTKWRCIVT